MTNNLDILKKLTDELNEKDTELKLSQKKYYEMFNSVAHPMILIDYETTRPIEVNDEAVEVYGYSKEEFMNIAKGQIVEDFDNFTEVIKNKKQYRVGFDKTKEGHKFPVEVYYSYYKLNGQTVVICSVIDITDKVNIIKDLTLKNELYKGLIENTSELIVRVDLDNNFTFINDTYCKLFGIDGKEYIGKSFYPLVHPDDVELTTKKLEEVKSPPYRVSYPQKAMTLKGWRTINWEVSLIFEDGIPREYQAVGIDITCSIEMKEQLIMHKEELSIKEQIYTKLIKLFHSPALITDLNHNILVSNDAAKEFMGAETLAGKCAYGIMIHEDDRERFYKDVTKHKQEKQDGLKEGWFEGYYKMKNSQIGHIKITSVKNLNQEPVMLIGTVSLNKGESYAG